MDCNYNYPFLVKASYNYFGVINQLYTNGTISNHRKRWLMFISFTIPLVGLAIISYYTYLEGKNESAFFEKNKV